jgi:hypothetical protein
VPCIVNTGTKTKHGVSVIVQPLHLWAKMVCTHWLEGRFGPRANLSLPGIEPQSCKPQWVILVTDSPDSHFSILNAFSKHSIFSFNCKVSLKALHLSWKYCSSKPLFPTENISNLYRYH